MTSEQFHKIFYLFQAVKTLSAATDQVLRAREEGGDPEIYIALTAQANAQRDILASMIGLNPATLDEAMAILDEKFWAEHKNPAGEG